VISKRDFSFGGGEAVSAVFDTKMGKHTRECLQSRVKVHEGMTLSEGHLHLIALVGQP
jgi:hypothetical protein